MLYDRLYGKLTFPPIVERLILCPGLCRLREVGLANVPFLAFPAFALSSRYEHSLGVCHLAELASQTLMLTETERIELMIACLYHDVVTPPFAHAMEEVLAEMFGFNHETYLRDLLLGKDGNVIGPRTQVFLGRQLALHQVCQSSQARKLHIDVFRIAELAVGAKEIRLSNLISGDIDLDNIDNVARSSSAMGIKLLSGADAEGIANCFTWHNDKVSLGATSVNLLRKWQLARETLYEYIYCSVKDFALQTMVKHMARLLLCREGGLTKNDWCLTDQQFIHERANKFPETKNITTRMRLGDTYDILALLWVEGPNVKKVTISRLADIETVAMKRFANTNVVANYMIDKRCRRIDRSLVFLGVETDGDPTPERPALLLGLFTPNKGQQVNPVILEAFIDELREVFGENSTLSKVSVREDTRPHLLIEKSFGDDAQHSLFNEKG